jgi:hypothetical protein
MDEAEAIFAGLCAGPVDTAYDELQYIVHDSTDVHRVVLAHRAWALVDLIGLEHAHTLLRQSVRYCVDVEQRSVERGHPQPGIRAVLPRLMDQFGLAGLVPGDRQADDAWIAQMVRTVYDSTPDQAAEAAAAALAEGFSIEAVGEALSLAANELVLRDRAGRTHGDSIGVHASDSINAWRNIARAVGHRNALATMVTAAYHTCGGGSRRNGPPAEEPYPLSEHRSQITATEPDALLRETEAAIRENDQGRATAAIASYGELGHDPRPAYDLLLRYAVSEDGRLHAEKYYRTVSEEYATTRPAFRWRQLVALARVTASCYGYDREDQHGYRAPGYEEACRLLGVA